MRVVEATEQKQKYSAQKRYNASEKGKATIKKYNDSVKGKQRLKDYKDKVNTPIDYRSVYVKRLCKETCDILINHFSEMQSDPERLTTRFICKTVRIGGDKYIR